jgi:hypothetical protein
MPQTITRDGVRRDTRPAVPPRGRCGPVLLATFAGAPPHPDATHLAVEAAFDTGATLLLADVVRRPRLRRRRTGTAVVALAPGLRPAADAAFDLSVRVERMRVARPRPVAALLAVVAEHQPSLVVFGPDPTALGRWRWRKRRRYRRFVTALAREAPCMLWTAQEPRAAAVSSAASPSSRAKPAPMRRASPGSATTIASPTSSQSATTKGKRS